MGGDCSPAIRQAVIGLIVLDHETRHIRGTLDEAAAECESVGVDAQSAQWAGLTKDEGRVIAWLHLMALNPSTPPQTKKS